MAEGDVAGLRQAAKDLDWAINSKIYLPSRALNAFVQSWKLFALIFSMGAALTLLTGLYRLRLRQVEEQFNVRLEERVNERTRIARELHDTLLQSFHGLMFQYQAARNMLPRQPDDAMQALDEAISGTEQALSEGRDAIHDIRQQAVVRGDLEELLESAGEELAALPDENRVRPKFQLIVEGESRSLSPAVQPAMPLTMARRSRLKWTCVTIRINCACACATTEKGSILKRSRKPGVPGIGVCPGSASARSASARIWIFGANAEPERKLS
jgi:signal transduction histidine kinase